MLKVDIKNICCIGAGYVGGPTMAVIADKCPDIKINVVDLNELRIASWNSNDLEDLPIYEPGLKEIINRVRNKNLFFSTDTERYISEADAIFISVNTPIKVSGLGAGQASNLCWVESCARQIARDAKGHTIVIEKSTLPVRTAEIIKEIIISSTNSSEGDSKTFSILSNPEFLAEGTAIDDLINPDRVLIGGDDNFAIQSLIEIYSRWVDRKKILSTNLWSSELSKLVANAFLAQRISSINSISALCEATGADISEVSRAVGLDQRIGSKFLNAGPGFGGSCFKKDILNLVYLCNFFGLKTVADFWEQVISINDWQQKRIYELIVHKLFGNIYGKKIVLLGFSFKANTNDTRESPSIQMSKYFLDEGANLTIHDPRVSRDQVSKELCNYRKKIGNFRGYWDFESDVYKSIENADGIIILTEWEEYSKLDWKKISNLVRKPGWVFDTRKIADKDSIKKTSLNYWSVGED